MRLQEVLKERETEIQSLEASLKEKEPSSIIGQSQNDADDPSTHLSPTTAQKFQAVRKNMELHGVTTLANGTASDTEVDESLDRLNELML